MEPPVANGYVAAVYQPLKCVTTPRNTCALPCVYNARGQSSRPRTVSEDQRTTFMSHQTGILIVGHGTRDRHGREEFIATAELAADLMPDYRVEHCFLELAEPTIEAGVRSLIESGARRIVIAPLLLFAAGHAKEDIPRLVEEAVAGVSVPLLQAEPLGCHAKLVAASAERFRQATETLSTNELTRTRLLLVGRGSSDPAAVAEMHRFAELRAENTPVDGVEVAFMAVAEPPIEAALAAAAQGTFETVVVQPHLLFHGRVLQTLCDLVDLERAESREKETEWLLAEHLGASRLVAEALVERCQEVLQ